MEKAFPRPSQGLGFWFGDEVHVVVEVVVVRLVYLREGSILRAEC